MPELEAVEVEQGADSEGFSTVLRSIGRERTIVSVGPTQLLRSGWTDASEASRSGCRLNRGPAESRSRIVLRPLSFESMNTELTLLSISTRAAWSVVIVTANRPQETTDCSD